MKWKELGKEVVVTNVKVLFQQLSAKTEGNLKTKLRQDS
jgi:hypothetical protein